MVDSLRPQKPHCRVESVYLPRHATTWETTMTDHADTHVSEDDPRNETILIWVDGRLLPRAEATVSVYDSGFMMGDGV